MQESCRTQSSLPREYRGHRAREAAKPSESQSSLHTWPLSDRLWSSETEATGRTSCTRRRERRRRRRLGRPERLTGAAGAIAGSNQSWVGRIRSMIRAIRFPGAPRGVSDGVIVWIWVVS